MKKIDRGYSRNLWTILEKMSINDSETVAGNPCSELISVTVIRKMYIASDWNPVCLDKIFLGCSDFVVRHFANKHLLFQRFLQSAQGEQDRYWIFLRKKRKFFQQIFETPIDIGVHATWLQ